jgi:hypothetical protein
MATLHRLRGWLSRTLITWGTHLAGPPPNITPTPPPRRRGSPTTAASPLPASAATGAPPPRAAQHPPLALFSPSSREPLSVEDAVLSRSMVLLKREASDSLAALGAAHALVTSARLSQVQHLRERVDRGDEKPEALAAMAADYQGWQNDQVRLFDAMALVLRMSVPSATTLELVDPQLHEQARAHLASLSAEYQRGLLLEQFRDTPLGS